MPTGHGPGWGAALVWNIIPVGIGNIGGALLVASRSGMRSARPATRPRRTPAKETACERTPNRAPAVTGPGPRSQEGHMTAVARNLDTLCVNTIRGLCMDAIEGRSGIRELRWTWRRSPTPCGSGT